MSERILYPQNEDLKISRTFESSDTSIKYILNTQDGRGIEAIYFPFKGNFDGTNIDASVVCLSSQIGCPASCTFCETGRMPNPRNLTSNELVSQLNLISSDLESKSRFPIDSIAMMGMGEPLLNLDNILRFYDIAMEDSRIKRFSISTVGIIPGIRNLKDSGKEIKLYISVHTPFNGEREKIIPVSIKYPISDVVAEAKKYAIDRKQKVVANYVLISGVNDSSTHLMALSELLDPKHFDVTLNLLNPISENKMEASSCENMLHFKQGLVSMGFDTDIQLSKGTDVSGGCGQLATKINDSIL